MRQYNDRIYVTKIPNLYSAKDCQIHRIQTYLNNLHQKSYRICTLSYTGLKMSLIRHKHVIFQVIVFLGHFNYFVSKFMAKSKSGGFNRLVIWTLYENTFKSSWIIRCNDRLLTPSCADKLRVKTLGFAWIEHTDINGMVLLRYFQIRQTCSPIS